MGWGGGKNKGQYYHHYYTYGLLQLKGSLHGLQRSAPLHGGWLGDVLEDNLPSSPVLILDELLAMLSLLVGVLLEEGGEAAVSDVISVEVASLQEMNKESNKGQIFFKDT